MSSGSDDGRPAAFDFIVATPPGLADPTLAIAASRSGAVGLLDLQFVTDTARALTAVEILARQAHGRCGIKLDSCASPLNERILSELPDQISIVVLSPIDPTPVADRVRALHARRITVLLESVSEAEALVGEAAGVDGLIAKGNESGGRVADETTFVLLQRLLGATALPVWAQGGIGFHSAAACLAAGAAGVVLDSQLALTRESTLPPDVKAMIGRLDGAETVCIGGELGACVRVFAPPGGTALSDLQRFVELREAANLDGETRREWWRQVGARIGWTDSNRQVWPIGQEAILAASLARRFDRVARVLDGIPFRRRRRRKDRQRAQAIGRRLAAGARARHALSDRPGADDARQRHRRVRRARGRRRRAAVPGAGPDAGGAKSSAAGRDARRSSASGRGASAFSASSPRICGPSSSRSIRDSRAAVRADRRRPPGPGAGSWSRRAFPPTCTFRRPAC